MTHLRRMHPRAIDYTALHAPCGSRVVLEGWTYQCADHGGHNGLHHFTRGPETTVWTTEQGEELCPEEAQRRWEHLLDSFNMSPPPTSNTLTLIVECDAPVGWTTTQGVLPLIPPWGIPPGACFEG